MALFLVLTVLGEDRPGLVESLSHAITTHDGNWLESRMARLAGKFAGILRASVPESQVEPLTSALHELESHGLRILLEWSTSDEAPRHDRWFTLDLVGTDRPGIIRAISRALARRGINIDELHTESASAPMSGEMLFKATAQLRVPPDVAIAELQDDLEHLTHDFMVDITLEHISVQTLT